MTKNVRLMLYSHDSWGLGHLRRNLAIARALVTGLPTASVLIISGSPCATQFRLPPRTDIVKLPAVGKDDRGAYQPRHLGGDLGSVLKLRRALLERAFESFQPHLVLVDHAVIGLGGEMLPVLQLARRAGVPCLYGMRDVLDAPVQTEAGWDSLDIQWALAHGYEQVLIYGEQQLFDTVACYPSLSRVAHKAHYVGLLANTPGTDSIPPAGAPHVVVTAGGGEDGFDLLRCYLAGVSKASANCEGCFSSVVAGPMLAPERYDELKALADRNAQVRLHRFHKKLPALIESADLVVSMAGYNSCAEILASGRPAILVPRTHPRQEQLLRARYLERAGLAEMVVQPTPESLWSAVRGALCGKTLVSRPKTALNGTTNLLARVTDILSLSTTTALGRDIARVAGVVSNV